MLGEDIICFKVGDNPNKNIIIQGSIHAREWICCLLILQQIKYLLNFKIDATIYFVPIVNIDGVKIVLNGANFIKDKKIKELIKSFKSPLVLYKANANGVDLNTNFDAFWGQGKSNRKTAGYANFIGDYPHSEPETRALIKLTSLVKPELAISYHCKGEVIYYGFKQKGKALKSHKKVLDKLNIYTGYRPIKTKNSCGGFTDYCIIKKGIFAYTFEVGREKFSHPFPISEFKQIVSKNLYLPLLATKII